MKDPNKPSDRISERWLPFGVFAFFLLFYSLTMTRNLSVAHDAMSYLVNITRGTDLDHPHHLLYHWTARIWLLLGQATHLPVHPALIVQSLNVLFASLTMMQFYRLLRLKLTATPIMAFLGTLLPATSYGFWFYATTIEVYIIPLFLLLSIVVLLSQQEKKSSLWYWVGLLHGLAILYHQVNILFGIVLLYQILAINRKEKTEKLTALKKYLSIVVPVAIVPYLFTYIFVRHFTTIAECWRWTTAYAQDDRYWNGFGIIAIAKILKGFLNAFIGGQFLLAIPVVQSRLFLIDSKAYIVDDLFLVKDLSPLVSLLLLVVTILALGILGYLFTSTKRKSRTIDNTQRVLLAWLVVYSLFFCFWDSGNVEFWIPQMLIAWFLLLVRIQPVMQNPAVHKSAVYLLSIVTGSLLIVNGVGSIYPLSQSNRDYYLQKTYPVAEESKQGDVIVTNYRWIVADYLDYFAKAEVIALADIFERPDSPSAAVQPLISRFEAVLAAGGSIYVTQDAVTIDRFTEEHYGAQVHEIETIWNSYRNHWKPYTTEIDTFYRISSSTSMEIENTFK